MQRPFAAVLRTTGWATLNHGCFTPLVGGEFHWWMAAVWDEAVVDDARAKTTSLPNTVVLRPAFLNPNSYSRI